MVDQVGTTWQVSVWRACRALPIDLPLPFQADRTGVLMNRIKQIADPRVDRA
jgi:hypothetical protein